MNDTPTDNNGVRVERDVGDMARHRQFDYDRQIPPPLDPNPTDWVPAVKAGYGALIDNVKAVISKLGELVGDGVIDSSDRDVLMAHISTLGDAIGPAVEAVIKWAGTGEITPEVHRIADHCKYVYAVGAREISMFQYRLARLAYDGKIAVEAHNELQNQVCDGIGEPISSQILSPLHDRELWDGHWGWDENVYSDGRHVTTKVHVTDWQELFDERPYDPAIERCDDGVIAEYPQGLIGRIAPVVDPDREKGRDLERIEISLAELIQQPWVLTDWGKGNG